MVSSQGAVGNLTQGMAGMNVSGQSNMMGEYLNMLGFSCFHMKY